ncbi:MAG: hypothetical protein AB4290_22800 [Spirulina sp.]
MSDIPEKLYAPNIHWFAYQLHEGQTEDPQALAQITPQWVARKYEQILTAFAIKTELKIRRDRPSWHFDLLQETELSEGRRYQYFSSEDATLEGFAYPQFIHDSYALHLNIFYPEKVGEDECEITDLARLNPQNCLQPEEGMGSLGQTLFLTAYLARSRPFHPQDLTDLARECILNLLPLENPENCPRLYKISNLFGGYLYEYGNPKAPIAENPYGHLLVWFFFDETPSLILQNCYWELPELLLYYHKIVRSYQQSRFFYKEADRLATENEQLLQQFEEKYIRDRADAEPLPHADLATLKDLLKELLKISLSYSQQLRNLEYARNTIAINASNYQYTLDRIEQLARNPLKNFADFASIECPAFQQQIAADLKYFQQGSSLLDKAIATVRGLIEIDQAERDRDRQKMEKDREKREQQQQQKREAAEQAIQEEIQAIGVGIAIGALFASGSGVMTQPWFWPNEKKIELNVTLPHPFLITVIGSLIMAIFAYKLTKWGIAKSRSPRQ